MSNFSTERRFGLEIIQKTRGVSVFQAVLALVEGISEALVLTLTAGLAVDAVVTKTDGLTVPALGTIDKGEAWIALLVLIVVRLVAGLVRVRAANRLERNIRLYLRDQVIRAHAGADVAVASRLDVGEIQQLMVNLPTSIAGQLSTLILNVGQVFMMLAMLAISLASSPLLTVGLIAAIAMSSLGFRPLRRRIRSRAKKHVHAQERLILGASETGSMALEAEVFGVRAKFSSQLLMLAETEADVSERVGRLKGSIFPLYISMTYVATSIGLVILMAGDSAELARSGPTLLIVLRALAYGQSIQQALGGIASVQPALSELQRAKKEFDSSSRKRGDRTVADSCSLRLRNVSFAYFGASKSALTDVSLEISPESRIGVLGPSGGGKSTLVRLMLGLELPVSGEILLDGRPLDDYRSSSLGEAFGFVPQEAKFFSGTIKENIIFLRDGISDLDVAWALQVADAQDFVDRLPNGTGAKMGAGGNGFSVGQYQRLSIARALVHRPKIVVMDEPTASLDAASEDSVSRAIEGLPRDFSLVIISHRKRILETCDRLVIVKAGRIVEVGPKSEIVSSSNFRSALGE